MRIEFEFESKHFTTGDLCNVHEIEIDVICTDFDGCDATYDLCSILDRDLNVWRELKDFPEDEVKAIEALCEVHADNNANEAYQDYAEGRADAMYDAWKDGTYD
jgi:hypothetical protein